MSGSWTVNVAGRSYGPYSAAQMQAFAAEGRLAPHSLVQRVGEQKFRTASEDPELSALFEPQKVSFASPSPHPDAAASSFGKQERDDGDEPSHFVIIADMKSGSVAGLEEEIFNLGPAFAVVPQVWILSSKASINGVRNTLIRKLGKIDILFVVDATHNKAAWFNFGPEAEARIRRIWTKTQDTQPKRSSAN
jgi:hypothetical protein